MRGFNLSRWALEHIPLTRYLIAALLIGGILSYSNLGQDEDPPFTFRVMVVRAVWPGATAVQMAEQVTDKLERKLQETPYIDKIRSYSKPGETAHHRAAARIDAAAETARVLVPGAQENRRHPRHPAAGRDRPVLQRRIRRHLRLDLRAVAATASPTPR